MEGVGSGCALLRRTILMWHFWGISCSLKSTYTFSSSQDDSWIYSKKILLVKYHFISIYYIKWATDLQNHIFLALQWRVVSKFTENRIVSTSSLFPPLQPTSRQSSSLNFLSLKWTIACFNTAGCSIDIAMWTEKQEQHRDTVRDRAWQYSCGTTCL